MHFLCSTFGSAGDVFPMFGLALALRERGHRVTFSTNPHYESLARRHEVPFEPLGTQEQFDACINHPDLWNPRRAFAHVFRAILPALRQQYDLHARHAGPATVGLTNCFGFGALLAQERFQMPVLTVHCQPAVLWSDYDPPRLYGLFGPRWLQRVLFRIGERYVLDPVACPALNAWRKELDLPPIRRLTQWWNSPRGVVCLFPSWYCPPQPDWPQPWIQTDFPLWNDRSDQPLDEEVRAFLSAGPPPVVFTPGSTNRHGEAFFAAALGACERLGRRAVLLTDYPQQVPQPLPRWAAHFRYVPLDRLLPEAAAFVHHGGIGSTSQALAAGIPQVLMPLAHDQFDNAQRVQRLRVGDWLGVRQFTAARLARQLGRLLESPAVQAACRQAAGNLVPRDGLSRAAAAIEQRIGLWRAA